MSGAVEVGGQNLTRRAQKRSALLCDEPQLLGASWARNFCESVRIEGRRVEGGWPGTLPEARARILGHLDRELLGRGMPPLNVRELVKAATATYERAKLEWQKAARGAQAAPPSEQGDTW